jgi:hypothetical protein
MWRVDPPTILDPESIEQRLVALRMALGDAEVIRLAEQGTLPLDPQYAEWLALLRRGDLLIK